MTAINICSVRPVTQRTADTKHGPCNPPERRLPSRWSSIVPIGSPQSSTPLPKPSSGAAWSGSQLSRRSVASLRRRTDSHADDSTPSLLSGFRNHRRYPPVSPARWDGYRQNHACLDLSPVRRDRNKRNASPLISPGQVRPDLPAVHVVQPKPQEAP